MRKRSFFLALVAAVLFVGSSALPAASPTASADHDEDLSKALLGVWAINFVVPVSPKGNNFGQPHRHKFEFREEDGQRTVSAKEILDIRVPGAWRAGVEQFSATFEFTCPDGVICGTITMRGGLDSENRMSGRVVIFWDEEDSTTQTGYDTVTGRFTGERCSGVRALHDTGGCDTP